MSWQLVGKSCENCGGSLSLSTSVGDRCPHCRVRFGGERTKYLGGGGGGRSASRSSSKTSDGEAVGGCLFLLLLVAAIGGGVYWYNSTPSVEYNTTIATDAAHYPEDDRDYSAYDNSGWDAESANDGATAEADTDLGAAGDSDSDPKSSAAGETAAGEQKANDEPPTVTLDSAPESPDGRQSLSSEAEPNDSPTAAPAKDGSSPLSSWRDWTDRTGQYRVRAKLVEATDLAVKLEKHDGRTVTVPRAKLSQRDLDYLALIDFGNG